MVEWFGNKLVFDGMKRGLGVFVYLSFCVVLLDEEYVFIVFYVNRKWVFCGFCVWWGILFKVVFMLFNICIVIVVWSLLWFFLSCLLDDWLYIIIK